MRLRGYVEATFEPSSATMMLELDEVDGATKPARCFRVQTMDVDGLPDLHLDRCFVCAACSFLRDKIHEGLRSIDFRKTPRGVLAQP